MYVWNMPICVWMEDVFLKVLVTTMIFRHHKFFNIHLNTCLLVFLVNYRASFHYYKHDQTINSRICCFRKCINVHHIHRLLYEYNNFCMKVKVF